MGTRETARPGAAWLDLSRHGVLGWRAHDVYRALGDTPQPVRLLVVVPSVSRATLFRVLRRLAGDGLAIQTAGGWALGPADPREVALRHGLFVRRTHERRQIAREREVYRDRLRGRRPRIARHGKKDSMAATHQARGLSSHVPPDGSPRTSGETGKEDKR